MRLRGTCIVGIADKSGVWMGADSLASGDYHKMTIAQPKVFRLGDMLIGVSGSIRVFNVLRYEVSAPVRGENETDDLRFLVCGVVNELREKLRNGGVVDADGGSETADFSILIGYRRKLYIVSGDFNVIQPKGNYWATGSGGEYALGSLYSTHNIKDTKKRITMALDAACAFSPACAPPYVFDHI